MIDPEGLLDSLHPEAARALKRLLRGTDARVRSGRRSCLEQAALYAIGRRTAGSVVTYAEGCRSWHVLGRAADIDLLGPDGRPVGDCASYQALGEKWEAMGGNWGGRFAGFGGCGDAGHFEWHPGLTIEQACPHPTHCAQIELGIDAEIALARSLGAMKVVLGATAVASAAVFAWWWVRH